MLVEKLTIKDTFRIWRDKLNSLIDKLATIPATDDDKKYVLNEETIGANKVIIDVPVSITSADSKIAGTLDGNAKTASSLQTSVTINGTEFDGTENIKTDFWGLKRNIRISDAEGKYYGNIVTVDGSDDFILTLPPIIITSACAMDSDKELAQNYGIDSYITKPIDINKFLLVVKSKLQN